MAYITNTGNIKGGACKIWVWEEDPGEYRAIGFTTGGYKIKYQPEWRDRKTDQTGVTPVGKLLMGIKGTVAFNVLETTKENLALAMPLATMYVNGSEKTVGVGLPVNADLYSYAKKFRIHPLNNLGTGGADDEAYIKDDLYIWKAASMDAFERSYSIDGDRIYHITLNVFPDMDMPQEYQMWIEGDPANIASIDTTPPSITLVQAEVSDVMTDIPTTGIDADTLIEVTLSEEINELYVSDKNILLINTDTDAILECSYGYDSETDKITLTPSSSLSSAVKYSLVITGLRDIAGNIMEPYCTYFTTA